MKLAITGCSHARCPEGDHYWASLDGEHWLEVNRLPRASDLPVIRGLFGSNDDGFVPMTYARRWLAAQKNARFL